jgi:hypothetical protein
LLANAPSSTSGSTKETNFQKSEPRLPGAPFSAAAVVAAAAAVDGVEDEEDADAAKGEDAAAEEAEALAGDMDDADPNEAERIAAAVPPSFGLPAGTKFFGQGKKCSAALGASKTRARLT